SGRCGACRIAARASRCRSATRATTPHLRGSGTCGWASASTPLLTAARERARWGPASRVRRQRFFGPAVDSGRRRLSSSLNALDEGGWTMTGATETAGRRIVVTEFVTLDGYMVGPDEDMSWVAAGFDRRMHDDIARDMDDTYDTFVFGRATYDIFAAYWPPPEPYDEGDELRPAEGKEDRRIIRALNGRPKVVFSTTMTDPKWDNTRVAGGLEDEIRRLKREPGKAMLVQG